MRWTVNAAARSHLMPPFQCGLWATQGLNIIIYIIYNNACTTDGPESRKTGHAALKQQLKLYSPQQQSLYIFIGLQYLWSAVRWRLLPTSSAAAGRCLYSVLLHLTLFITGTEKGRPGIHTEVPDWTPHSSHVQTCQSVTIFTKRRERSRMNVQKNWIQTFCRRRSEATHQQWDENIFCLNCIFEHNEGRRSRRSYPITNCAQGARSLRDNATQFYILFKADLRLQS